MKKTVSNEKFFVIWPEGDLYAASDYPTLDEAEASAIDFLNENESINGEYYVAKAVKKCYYKGITEDI